MVALLVLVLPGCNHCECTYSYADCGQPPTFNPARVLDRTGKCTDRRALFTSYDGLQVSARVGSKLS